MIVFCSKLVRFVGVLTQTFSLKHNIFYTHLFSLPWILVFFCLVFIPRCYGQSRTIRVGSEENSYVRQLLDLALSASDWRDQYQFIYNQDLVQSKERQVRLIAKSKFIDITALAVTKQRMDRLRAIQIPIYFGALGYRVFLINNKNQSKFTGISSIKELRRLNAIFVNGWADTQVLENNKIPTFITSNRQLAYSMIERNRGDYFPRGLHEVLSDYRENVEQFPSLAIGQRLALYYPLPVYYFVSYQSEELAQQVEKGLLKVLSDGGMRTLFLEHFAESIQSLNLAKRNVIELHNDGLPSDINLPSLKQWQSYIQSQVLDK